MLRQELALVAIQGNRVAVVQFNRSSAPPRADVELTLAGASAASIEILAPDLRPVAGAKVKIVGLISETIHTALTEAEAKLYAGGARKTALGYVIGTDIVALPPDAQIDLGATDARGQATVASVAVARVGAVTVHSDDFGEQTVGYRPVRGTAAPDWAKRIVLKPTGRLVGQLASPLAASIAQREVTLTSFAQDDVTGVFYSSSAKVVTDRDGRFTTPRLLPGAVQIAMAFDPRRPTLPDRTLTPPHLKSGETLQVRIDLKSAVRVVGRVLEAESKRPIHGVAVRVYVGTGFESATSDTAGTFVFWMPPGETAFQPDIPAEYLTPLAPSDYLDPAKYQRRATIFKVPEGKSFEAPPILLYRPATVQGVVVDDLGRPLAGARISAIALALDRRTGQPKPREVTTQANEKGAFALPAIDPREPLRLRATAGAGSKVVSIAKPGSQLVRIVLTANERFQISGQVADAAGKPVADALLEIWHRDWRPAPNVAEPQKFVLNEPVRADAQGRFQTPPLVADGHYRFTIRAAGAKTAESAWLDATGPGATKPQQLVITRLGGTAGVVRDQGGKPIRDVLVSVFAKDTRAETVTDGHGEFKLETPAGKPFCIVVHHSDFRANGAFYDRSPPDLNQTMIRMSEPVAKLERRPILAKAEREKLFQRLLEPVKQKLAQSTSTQAKVALLQSLTGSSSEFVTEFLDKHPLQPAMDTEMLRTQLAMKRVADNPEEAEELIGRLEQGAQKSMAYGLLVDALPEPARAHKREILAEALVAARAEKAPEFRAIALGQVAKRLYLLGEKDRATGLLREGEKIAGSLATSGFAGYARGSFATDLALIDLPAALALMKDLKDPSEFARHHGNTAHRIAGMHPAEAVKVLAMIPPPRQNEFNQREQYAIRVGYRMAQADRPAALKLASSIADLPTRAYALGVIALGIARTEPRHAADVLRRAFTLLEEEIARPDPPQLTSPLLPGTVGAALVLLAEEIDPTLVRECLWRSIALQRPYTADPQQVWRSTTGNSALAMVAARYDARLAAFLLPVAPAAPGGWVSREAQLARFLAQPQRAVEAAAQAPKSIDDRQLVQLLTHLATEEDRIPRLILNTLGLWRVDVEDIDL